MKKKILTLAVALVLLLTLSTAFAPIPVTASASSNLAANPTASTVYVNGAAKAFEAYIINGNNYFKLRDLAYVLNGSAKQFEVGYDNATKAITLTTGRAYTPDGGEMARGDGRAKTASPTASRIYLDGRELNLTVYLIGGNNFFKLRDLMEAIDVFVGYDNATKAITLDTSKGYEPEASTPTPTPTPTPSGNASVIGTWLYGSARAEWPYEEWTKTNFLYGVAAGLYTFRSDGAYSYQFRSYTGFFDDYVQQQGKYRVDGNRIILYDRTEDYIDFEFPNENYSGKVLGERVLYYQFTQMSNGIEAMNIEASVEALNSESNPPWNWERAN